MPELTIDNRSVTVAPGQTILDGANRLGIRIPTLCHHPALPAANACMVCLVRDAQTGRFMPACSYPATEGMVIDASSNEVVNLRRETLKLLLREHLGDCEAPCRRACPANLDIPAMMRAVAAGDWATAGRVVRQHIPLPLILGTICPEPCAKLCRRKDWDAPLAICRVKYLAGETTVATEMTPAPASGKSVAIVGGGPAGASAAWFLRQMGHACSIVERSERPWLPLVEKVGRERLPEAIAKTDYEALLRIGIDSLAGRELSSRRDLDALREGHDAVLLAGGEDMRSHVATWGIALANVPTTFPWASECNDVFLAGAARAPSRLAAQAVGDGRLAAFAMHAFLQGRGGRTDGSTAFDAHAGRLHDLHLAELAQNSRFPEKGASVVSPPRDASEAVVEAGRCMACDCRAKDDCDLRAWATAYGIGRVQAQPPEVDGGGIVRRHPEVVYEPGKCIRCGLCVRLSEARNEQVGLALSGRGRNTRLCVPLGLEWRDALETCAGDCLELCPTGALVAPER